MKLAMIVESLFEKYGIVNSEEKDALLVMSLILDVYFLQGKLMRRGISLILTLNLEANAFTVKHPSFMDCLEMSKEMVIQKRARLGYAGLATIADRLWNLGSTITSWSLNKMQVINLTDGSVNGKFVWVFGINDENNRIVVLEEVE